MINVPWWADIPKDRLREIQEQKIFKRGEYPKLDYCYKSIFVNKIILVQE